MLTSTKTTREKLPYIIISTLLVLSFLIKIKGAIYNFWLADLNSWNYSEFLINYQGGFVRRGLLGEIIFQPYQYHNFPLKESIYFVCWLAFFILLAYYLYQFHQRHYCWWILLSPVFFNFVGSVVRKDYILYLSLILILYLLKSNSHIILKKIIACALLIFSLFIHEAFIFWGYIMYALILWGDKRNRTLNIFLISIPLIIFVILSIFKGSPTTAHMIVDSWNSILPSQLLNYEINNSIGAIGWNALNTFFAHLRANLGHGAFGLIIIPLIAIAIYYLFTNYFITFGNNKAKHEDYKLVISLLYSSIIIGLIPMLTILSCDVGRIFQYATMTTFSTFLIIPRDRILSLYPVWYKRGVIRFNNWLTHMFPPTKAILVFILLFIGVSHDWINFNTCWSESVVGSLLNYLNLILSKLYHLL